MDNIRQIMSTQLTETEVMVYLLVQNGDSYRTIAELPFGMSKDTAQRIYLQAKPKMDKFAELGLFTTPVENSIKKD